MRLFCTPNIALLIYTFLVFIHITAALHRKRDEGDASLFEFDEMESNEEDTYRMIERMQDVSPEDQVEDDEIKEIERMDRKIQDEQLHIKQHEPEEDNIPDEDEVKQQEEEEEEEEQNNSENNDDEVEENDDDEDGEDDEEVGDYTEEINEEGVGPYDFKNEDEAEFFENLPASPQNHDEEGQDHLKAIDEEEEDVHSNNNNNNNNNSNTNEEEEEEEELEEEEALVQPTMPIPQESRVEAPIPWQRPNTYGKIDTSSFYQDENAIRVVEKSRFKMWHSIAVLAVLVLVYRSLPRKKNNGLDLTWNKDEKDFLPLHNKSRYYKSEIKNC